MVIQHPDCKCPVCGKEPAIAGVERWLLDGQVPLDGIRLRCTSQPNRPGARRDAWNERHWREPDVWLRVNQWVQQWFNQFFRYRFVQAEVVAKKRRMKWRRLG